jgi:tRNA-dihydrouridine synthase
MPSNPWISLAPIQGITDAIYRKVFRDFFPGVDCYYAPFIKVQKDSKQHKGLRSRIPAHNEAVPLVLQILSNDPDEFPVLDEELWKSGYQEFNWNLGCPVSMVAKKRRGSGLLPHADKIQAILESVMPRLHCRLSIKLRLGMNDPNEILALIPIFNQFPIKELIIHPRLGKQLYRGQVDLGNFEEIFLIRKRLIRCKNDFLKSTAGCWDGESW